MANYVCMYVSANGLNINSNKSMALLSGAAEYFISNLPSIQINGSNIGFVGTAKILGVTLNRVLNWSDLIKINYGKTIAVLRKLWMSQYFTATNIRMLLAKAYLLPNLM